jgi:hypothetical protein
MNILTVSFGTLALVIGGDLAFATITLVLRDWHRDAHGKMIR